MRILETTAPPPPAFRVIFHFPSYFSFLLPFLCRILGAVLSALIIARLEMGRDRNQHGSCLHIHFCIQSLS